MIIMAIIFILLLLYVIIHYWYIQTHYKTEKEKHSSNGNESKKKELKGYCRFFYNAVTAIKEPYKVIFKERHRMSALLWFLFTIFAAQIGTLINLINHVIFSEEKAVGSDWWKLAQESLCMDSLSGSFYTFSIVLTASVLSPLFVKFVESGVHFRKLKVLTIVISIFTLFFGGIFYSFSTVGARDYSQLKNAVFNVDTWQLLFFIAAILIAMYSYGLSRMDLEAETYPNLDDYDYTDEERKRIESIKDTTTPDNPTPEEEVEV